MLAREEAVVLFLLPFCHAKHLLNTLSYLFPICCILYLFTYLIITKLVMYAIDVFIAVADIRVHRRTTFACNLSPSGMDERFISKS